MAKASFQLEAGKFYQTREGGVVGPIERRENFDTHPWWASAGSFYVYLDNGRLYTDVSTFGESSNDLVAEVSKSGVDATEAR